ncbi:Anaphase-promoting complex subunit 10, partial [Linum grandiflorum]
SPTSLWRNFKTASASFVRSSVEIELGNGKRVSFELTAARVSDQSQSFMATESSEGEEEGKITGGSQHLTVEDDLRELGKKAAWSVSSCKTGNGVSSLRDDNLDTYWQSDGAQPHLVNIQFQKKVKLQLDESYTPSKISIRAGDGFHNLKDIKTVELVKPTGWVYISLSGNDPRETFVNTFMLQIAVLSNHLNGRDTHIRQIKVYGPRPNPIPHQPFQFTSTEFITYSSVR